MSRTNTQIKPHKASTRQPTQRKSVKGLATKLRAKRSAKRKAASTSASTAPGLGLILLILLIAVPLCLLAPILLTAIANNEPLPNLYPLAVYSGAVLMAIISTRKHFFSGDRGLITAALLLTGIGVAVQTRLGSPGILMPLTLGLGLFLVLPHLFNPQRLTRIIKWSHWPCWLLALGIMAVLLVFGRNYRGGLYLPGRINPTELVKPLLVIFLAGFLPKHLEGFSRTVVGIPIPTLKSVFALAFAWLPVMALGVLIKDLGLLLILCTILMLSCATRKPGWLLLGLGATAGAGWAVSLISSHAATRFTIWLHPFTDPTGKSWQTLQSLAALYAGGLHGTGLGNGFPQNVPIVTSDFIYAALAEELGLIGCGLILLTYLLLTFRGLSLAAQTHTPQLQLLGAGLTTAIATQVLLNIGGVTNALPMTGITLPFISAGGFSLITSLAIAGLLTALSRSEK